MSALFHALFSHSEMMQHTASGSMSALLAFHMLVGLSLIQCAAARVPLGRAPGGLTSLLLPQPCRGRRGVGGGGCALGGRGPRAAPAGKPVLDHAAFIYHGRSETNDGEEGA